MKKLSTELLILFGLLLSFVFFILTFAILKHYTLVELESLNKIAEFYTLYTTPLIGLIGAILLWHSFKAQLKANKIQIKALKKESNRYKINTGYDRLTNLLHELQTSKENIKITIDTPKEFIKANGYDSIVEFDKFINSDFDKFNKLESCEIRNLDEFSDSFTEFLHLTILTINLLTQFSKYKDDNSYFILRAKFFKTIGGLNLELSSILKDKKRFQNKDTGTYHFFFIEQDMISTLNDLNKFI